MNDVKQCFGVVKILIARLLQKSVVLQTRIFKAMLENSLQAKMALRKKVTKKKKVPHMVMVRIFYKIHLL
jgi:hypothetical protein